MKIPSRFEIIPGSKHESLKAKVNEIIAYLESQEPEVIVPGPKLAEWSQAHSPVTPSDWKPVGDGSKYWMPPTGYKRNGVNIAGMVPTSEVPPEALARNGQITSQQSQEGA